MASLYDALYPDGPIPLFVREDTAESDVIVYETNEQRNARLFNEMMVQSLQEQIEMLQHGFEQLASTMGRNAEKCR